MFTSLLEVSERLVDPEIHLACAKAMAHLCKGTSSLDKFVSSKFMDPYLHEIVSSWEESLKDYSRKCAEVMRNMLKTALTYILHELPIENVKEDDVLKYHVDDFLLVGKYILESVKDIDYTVRITMVVSSWSYIETTLLTLQKWNMEEFSMIVLGCLTSFYDEVFEKEGEDMLTSQNFGELMLVAEKIYKRFGSKMGEDAKASLKFHLKGINFASGIVPEKEEMLPRIHFIRPLTVFATVVDPRFRKNLLDYLSEHKQSLKKKLPSVPEEFVDNLPHFLEYEKILSSSEWVIKPKKHAKKRREKATVIPGIPSGDGEEMEID
ncbi:hypothetical protein J437_LFUL005370 [Ladona fulva]|uniref:Uncharacterized protein n=1 Tax=Ladona fulva TaxID=123851 RepID=A0A8K0JZ40_LADFU|nr:hypothetical protein J437_LFUL005370 [Ladona fulva]